MDAQITRRDTTAAIHTSIVFSDGRDFELVTFYKSGREPRVEVHSRIFSMETSHDGDRHAPEPTRPPRSVPE